MTDAYTPKWPQFATVTPAMVTDEGNLHCLECKRSFKAHRSDARFCSQNCRKQASRRKERTRRMARNAINCLLSIQRMVRDYPDVGIVASLEVEKIQNTLNVTLAAVTPNEE